MAQKPKKGTRLSRKYKWLGHIEVYFSDEERAEAMTFLDTYERTLADTVDIILQSECAIKFSYDDIQDCYRVVLQTKDKDCYLYGYTLGLNHVRFVRLLGLALYTLTVLVENGGIQIPAQSTVNDF